MKENHEKRIFWERATWIGPYSFIL